MTIVFFGSDDFAAKVLDALFKNNLPVSVVITVPDKPKGRSKKLAPTPVKEYMLAEHPDIPLYQPAKVSSPEFVSELKEKKPELFIVAIYSQFLRQNILDVPSIGTINVHPSLLPKYRGPSPIQSAVLAGEKEAGVTIMEISMEIDAGDILDVEKISVPEEATFGEVKDLLCGISCDLLVRVVKKIIENKKYDKTPQDHSQATFTKKISPADTNIDFTKPAWKVHDLIRGMSPSPGARCKIEISEKEKTLKILKSSVVDIEDDIEFSDQTHYPGDVVSFDRKKGFIITCKNSYIRIHVLQLEGKKEMQALDFTNGFSQPVFLVTKR